MFYPYHTYFLPLWDDANTENLSRCNFIQAFSTSPQQIISFFCIDVTIAATDIYKDANHHGDCSVSNPSKDMKDGRDINDNRFKLRRCIAVSSTPLGHRVTAFASPQNKTDSSKRRDAAIPADWSPIKKALPANLILKNIHKCNIPQFSRLPDPAPKSGT